MINILCYNIIHYQHTAGFGEKHALSFSSFDRIKVAIRVSPVFPLSHTVDISYARINDF